jgi:hypothetical protein
MRKFLTYLLGASGLAMAAQAEAANFFFSSGSYLPGVTAPEPLMSTDILELTTGSNKFWDGVSLTNQTGTVNWQQGSLFMQNGATINNQSLWNATSDNGIFNNGGPLSTFTNSGTFQKSGGIGNTTLSSIAVSLMRKRERSCLTAAMRRSTMAAALPVLAMSTSVPTQVSLAALRLPTSISCLARIPGQARR